MITGYILFTCRSAKLCETEPHGGDESTARTRRIRVRGGFPFQHVRPSLALYAGAVQSRRHGTADDDANLDERVWKDVSRPLPDRPGIVHWRPVGLGRVPDHQRGSEDAEFCPAAGPTAGDVVQDRRRRGGRQISGDQAAGRDTRSVVLVSDRGPPR